MAIGLQTEVESSHVPATTGPTANFCLFSCDFSPHTRRVARVVRTAGAFARPEPGFFATSAVSATAFFNSARSITTAHNGSDTFFGADFLNLFASFSDMAAAKMSAHFQSGRCLDQSKAVI